MASGPITSWQIDGEAMETMTDFIFGGSKITADGDCSHEIKRHLLPRRKAMTNLDNILKSRHHFAGKGLYSQSYGFSSSHIRIWVLDHKEGWTPKKWCFQIVVLEKTLESPLTWKEIKPVNPKGNQLWIFIGRTDAEAKAPELEGHLMRTADSLEIRPWGWEKLKAKGEKGGRGWDGWIASPIQWTWASANSGR